MSKKIHYSREQVVIWLRKSFPEVNWDKVEAELPPIVWRSRWNLLAEKFGLPYTRRYLQNLDCLGKGPGNVKL